MPSLNMPVQRLKVAILPLDLPCSGSVTHSGEILTIGKSHGKKPDRFSLNDDMDDEIHEKNSRIHLDRLQNKCTNYKGVKNNTNIGQINGYNRSWTQHVHRMPRDRLPRVMKHYSPNGRRNHGRPLKRLLDTCDRNGSTSGPTP